MWLNYLNTRLDGRGCDDSSFSICPLEVHDVHYAVCCAKTYSYKTMLKNVLTLLILLSNLLSKCIIQYLAIRQGSRNITDLHSLKDRYK